MLHELKLRHPKLKIYPVEKKIRDMYYGFTDDTINILENIIVRTQSNGWISEETPFFITGGHERKILGNDNLTKIGIEVKQKKCPQPTGSVSQPPFESKWIKPYSPTDKLVLFSRVGTILSSGKIPKNRKVTHFSSPFKHI